MKKIYTVPEHNIEQLVQLVVIDFSDYEIELDDQLFFLDNGLKYLQSGLQECTLMYRKNKLRLPSKKYMPCYEVAVRKFLGTVKINKVLVSTIESFTDEDAKKACFYSKEDMIRTLASIYNALLPSNEIVSVYFIETFFRADSS